MNKKITLTLTKEEYELILAACNNKTLRPATYCKMILMENLHEQNKQSKSAQQ